MDADIIGLMEIENNGLGITLNAWIRLAHKKNNQTSETSGIVTADNTMSNFDFENTIIFTGNVLGVGEYSTVNKVRKFAVSDC
eukprot:12745908-Ditylum_brightwellii.AAC.1